MRFSLLLGCVVSFVLVSGCGDDKRPAAYSADVFGAVTLDGRPLEHGTITFIPDVAESAGGRPGLARIGPDGAYQIGNANPHKPSGLKPGRYRVTVLAMRVNPMGNPIATLAVPECYTDDATTPFLTTASPGANKLDFDLKSP